MKVAAYTGGPNLPSARLRIRQYIRHLLRYDVEVREYTLRFGKSQPKRRICRAPWAVSTVIGRLTTMPLSHLADVTLFNRNAMPAFIPFEVLTKRPRVLDVDDAIWLSRGGHRCGPLAQACDVVICGNGFLADWFSQWNQNVCILPTAVDTDVLVPNTRNEEVPPVIGWTGTGQNLRYLYDIEKALAITLERFERSRLLIISDTVPTLSCIPADRVQFVRWSPSREATALRLLSIGIMPLANGDWERGKCSLKMLNYMACGVPTVVSPVGMNGEVLRLGNVGFAASTTDEWVEALTYLLGHLDAAKQIGDNGRSIAVQYFSVRRLTSKLAAILYRSAGYTVPESLPRSPRTDTAKVNTA